MKIKDGVTMPYRIEMRKALIEAERVWDKHGQELVVTSGMEGTHSAQSLHYYGYAMDLRTNYFTPAQANHAVTELRSRLGNDYDVVLERTHCHVEYQKVLEV